MAAYLRKYDNGFISAKMEKMKIKDKDLVELTKEVDPAGKGLAHMTCRRARLGEHVSLETLFLICCALGVKPERSFLKNEEV